MLGPFPPQSSDPLALALAVAACFALGVWASLPMAAKPLSEDDGRWYYYALFRERGLRLGRDFIACGFFNVQWFAALAYRLFRGRDADFFPRMKVVLYGANAASACLAGSALFGGVLPGLGAGSLLALVQAVPSTLFMLTYAEHYALLPANLALACAVWGAGGGGGALALAAGVCAGVVVQFKPTGILFAAALPLVLLAAPQPGVAIGWYAAGCLLVQAAPLAILGGAGAAREYLAQTFVDPYRDGVAALLVLAGLSGGVERMSGYVRTRHEDDSTTEADKLRANCGRAVADLRAVLVLAVAAAVVAPAAGMVAPMAVCVGLAVLHLAAQQLQKNYYTPHFNPLWQPLALAGGWALGGLASWTAGAPLLGVMLWFVVLWLSAPALRAVHAERAPGREYAFGILHPYVGTLFHTAKRAGEVLRERTPTRERVCVWGDQPSVYLYARRMAFSHHHLFLYSHHARLFDAVWVLHALRREPPARILFFNWRYRDGWDMARVADAVGVAYELEGEFTPRDASGSPIPAPHGAVVRFPLYVRDEVSHVRALLERAIQAPPQRAREHLERVASLCPDHGEAGLRLRILEEGDGTPRAAMRLASGALRRGTPGAALVLAEALMDAGEDRRAADVLAPMVDAGPDDARVLAALGRAHWGLGDGRRAARAVRRAIDADPMCQEARWLLGELLLAGGDHAGAENCFSRVLLWNWRHGRAGRALDALTGGPCARTKVYDEAGVFGYHTPEALAEREDDPAAFLRAVAANRKHI